MEEDNENDDSANIYEYIQACYVAEGIPTELLEEVWPTVDFLVSTTSTCDYDDGHLFYSQQTEEEIFGAYFEVDNQTVRAEGNVSDEEEEEAAGSSSDSEGDDQNEEIQPCGLEIDRILGDELKRLNLSRQTRRQNRRKQANNRNSFLLAGLIQKKSVSAETDTRIEVDPCAYTPTTSECFSLLARISESIPESNDDLDDYRLASSIYVNTKLLEYNKQLHWKVDALGKCLRRALNELSLFRLSLESTVGDLRTEIEILRKNTLSTIKRIIQGDITRREQMQQQWDEVQSFIRRKNKRITELTEQLSGADIEVGFLLASHRERIESACIAERKFFRVSERLEDLELELKKKKCSRCEANSESSAQDKVEQEEILRKREERRRQFEDNEKQQIASAERYGKVLQNHIESTIQDIKNSALPWHGQAEKQNGQPTLQRGGTAQPSSDQKLNNCGYVPGFIPYEVYHVTRMRAEEVEKEVKKQERMNEILSKDLTDCKSTLTKIKNENSELKSENNKLLDEIKKLKANPCPKHGKQNSGEGIDTPPDSNSSDKSKEDFNNLPKPPSPPEILERPPMHRTIKDSPILAGQQSLNKRKRGESSEKKTKQLCSNKEAFGKLKPPPKESFSQDNARKTMLDKYPVEKRYFSSPQRSRRSVSPEPKRPAFAPPPSFMPPLPLFHKDRCRPEQDHPPPSRNQVFYESSFTDDASYRSFSPPAYHRRDPSPPSPKFEPMPPRVESWNIRPPPFRSPLATPTWISRAGPQNMQMNPRPVYANGPSFRPPSLSPTPPERQPLRLWHNPPAMLTRPQVRSTSWLNNGSSFNIRR